MDILIEIPDEELNRLIEGEIEDNKEGGCTKEDIDAIRRGIVNYFEFKASNWPSLVYEEVEEYLGL